MAKREWLYCGNDWYDIIDIIKLEKNHDERLREFHDILKRDYLTIKDVIDSWCVIEKADIKNCVDEWFFNDDVEFDDLSILNNNSSQKCTYWFFNINTGESKHVNITLNVSVGIIED